MNLQTAIDLINRDRPLTVQEATDLTDWMHLDGGADLLPAPIRHRAAPRLAYWSTDLALASIAWETMDQEARRGLCFFCSINELNASVSLRDVPVIQRFQLADQLSDYAEKGAA